MSRETGRVKWFNATKGFGFIQTDTIEDIFVHYREICGEGFLKLKKNQIVSFERMITEKGTHAKNVEIIDT